MTPQQKENLSVGAADASRLDRSGDLQCKSELAERQIDDIEQLNAQTDATVERVMANVAKIRTKARA